MLTGKRSIEPGPITDIGWRFFNNSMSQILPLFPQVRCSFVCQYYWCVYDKAVAQGVLLFCILKFAVSTINPMFQKTKQTINSLNSVKFLKIARGGYI